MIAFLSLAKRQRLPLLRVLSLSLWNWDFWNDFLGLSHVKERGWWINEAHHYPPEKETTRPKWKACRFTLHDLDWFKILLRSFSHCFASALHSPTASSSLISAILERFWYINIAIKVQHVLVLSSVLISRSRILHFKQSSIRLNVTTFFWGRIKTMIHGLSGSVILRTTGGVCKLSHDIFWQEWNQNASSIITTEEWTYTKKIRLPPLS